MALSAPAAEHWVRNTGGRAATTIVPRGSAAFAAIEGTVAMLTADGNIAHSSSYRVDNLEIAAAGDGYAFAGYPGGSEPVSTNILAGRLNADGGLRWAKRITTRSFLVAPLVAGGSDGGVFVAAITMPASLFIASFGPDGTSRWQHLVRYSARGRLRTITAMRDGSVIVFTTAGNAATAIRFSANGEGTWQRSFGAGDAAPLISSASETLDGDLLVCGSIRNDLLFARLAKSGKLVWQRAIGGEGIERCAAIAALDRNRVAMLAQVQALDGKRSAWMVVIDSAGNVVGQHTAGSAELVDFYAAIAPADDGLIWASWDAGAGAVIAKIGLDELTCDGAATSEKARATGMTPFDSPPQITTPEVQIDTVALTETHPTVRLKDGCPVVSASSRIPAALVPSLAARKKDDVDVFVDQVVAMLKARKFAELDALYARALRGRETFAGGSWKIWWFFEAFNPASRESFAALGDDAAKKLLNDWYAATKSTTSSTARASYLLNRAWQARSHEFSDRVTPASRQKFESDSNAALAILDDLRRSGQCDVSCLDLRIRARQLGGWSPELREIVAKEPMFWHPISDASVFLLPQWGGSGAAIEKFAREAADATRAAMGDTAYMKVMINTVGAASTGDNPKYDWPRLKKDFEDFQRRYPGATSNLEQLVRFAHLENDRETARTIIAANPTIRVAPNVRIWAMGIEVTPAPAPQPQRQTQTSMLARTRLRTPRGEEQLVVFVVDDRGKRVGVSMPLFIPADWSTATWKDEAGQPIASAISTAKAGLGVLPTILFEPTSNLKVTPLAVSSAPIDRSTAKLRIIVCEPETNCVPLAIPARISTSSSELSVIPSTDLPFGNWNGAPVVDEKNAVVGILKKGGSAPNERDVEPIEQALRATWTAYKLEQH
jgi:hypothetical protein